MGSVLSEFLSAPSSAAKFVSQLDSAEPIDHLAEQLGKFRRAGVVYDNDLRPAHWALVIGDPIGMIAPGGSDAEGPHTGLSGAGGCAYAA